MIFRFIYYFILFFDFLLCDWKEDINNINKYLWEVFIYLGIRKYIFKLLSINKRLREKWEYSVKFRMVMRFYNVDI